MAQKKLKRYSIREMMRKVKEIEIDHQRPCHRKRKYDSRGEAKSSANEQLNRCGIVLRVYQCPTCRGWHLTKRLEG